MAKKQYRNLGIWNVSKKSEFWEKFSLNINGDFKIITTVSRDLNRLELKSEYRNVKITIEESDTKPLFITCRLNGIKKMTWFSISKNDFIEKIVNLFNSKKISSENKDYDKKYITKTDNSQIIKSLIDNSTITNLILINDLTFIGGKISENGEFVISINVHRNINNFNQFEAIYNLTTRIIDVFIK